MPLNPDTYDPNQTPDGVYLCTMEGFYTKKRDGSYYETQDGVRKLMVKCKTERGRFLNAFVNIDDDGINRLCRAASITTEQLQGAEANDFHDTDYCQGLLGGRLIEIEAITREQTDPNKKPFQNLLVNKPGDAAERARKKAEKHGGQQAPQAAPQRPAPPIKAPQGGPVVGAPPARSAPPRWGPPTQPQRQPGEDDVPWNQTAPGSGIGKPPPDGSVPF